MKWLLRQRVGLNMICVFFRGPSPRRAAFAWVGQRSLKLAGGGPAHAVETRPSWTVLLARTGGVGETSVLQVQRRLTVTVRQKLSALAGSSHAAAQITQINYYTDILQHLVHNAEQQKSVAGGWSGPKLVVLMESC